MKKRFIGVTPYSAADASLEDLLDQYGAEGGDEDPGTGTADEAGDEGTPGDPQEQDDDNDDDPGDGGDGGTDDDETTGAQHNQKISNNAYAQMRIANKQLTGLLGKLAKSNGIEYKDTQDLITKLNDDALTRISKQSNVPVEVLREIEELRNDSQTFKQEQAQVRLQTGFKSLIADYGLDEKALRKYCAEVDSANIDVSNKDFDIVSHYESTHMKEIIDRKVQAAIAAMSNQNSNTEEHSSKPLQKQSRGGNGGETKVNTQAALENLLKGYPSK